MTTHIIIVDAHEATMMARCRDNNANPNITVRGPGLDIFIFPVLKVIQGNIKSFFKSHYITPIESKQTYDKMQLTEQELARNTLTVKVNFGGGTHGCLGVVYSDSKWKAEVSKAWRKPALEGVFLTFPDGDSTNDKKLIIA